MNDNSSWFQKSIKSAKIIDIREQTIGRKIKPVFVIAVRREDETAYEITREYKDFFQLQCLILDSFPVEGGQTGLNRIIPCLPGRRIFARDNLDLAQERKPELNKYMSELLKLSENISQSQLVLDFFARKEVEFKDLGDDLNERNNPDTSHLHCYVNTSYNSDGEQQNCA